MGARALIERARLKQRSLAQRDRATSNPGNEEDISIFEQGKNEGKTRDMLENNNQAYHRPSVYDFTLTPEYPLPNPQQTPSRLAQVIFRGNIAPGRYTVRRLPSFDILRLSDLVVFSAGTGKPADLKNRTRVNILTG